MSTLWRNKYTHWTVDAIMFFLCRIASCLCLRTLNLSTEYWKIADCSKTYLVHFPAKDVKKCVMSNIVYSEWPNAKLTAALSGIVCDLKWIYSSVTSGLEGLRLVHSFSFSPFFLRLYLCENHLSSTTLQQKIHIMQLLKKKLYDVDHSEKSKMFLSVYLSSNLNIWKV